ncbi:hypothetical protein Emin_0540 [Elusimicrobium minutum Pei191]|uniref:POTRA domain-containing protein n=1 Tax=Elusimicrobium minutum (strain Pei191) TaxID=445932 RepID=B2KCH4_ELUMP|nr:hypothetical protein [Elusimicrobium minutum]ACC98095.1 hypothetical protein Emin_0540 [Elusimicrobium minutum Pei191]
MRNKNLVYYKKTQPPEVKRKRTNRPNIIRPVIILVVLFLLAGSVCYTVYKAAPRVKAKIINFQVEGYSNWHYKTLEVSGLDAAHAALFTDAVSFKAGDKVSTDDCRKLEKRLSNLFVDVKDIKVKRGLFTGKLRISAKQRKGVAVLSGPWAVLKVIASDGMVYPVFEAQSAASLPVVVIPDINEGEDLSKVSKEFVQLVDGINAVKKDIDFKTLYIDKEARSAKVLLEGGNIIDFGKADNLAEKAKISSKILDYGNGKVKGPFTVNLEYYSGGKAYLVPQKN